MPSSLLSSRLARRFSTLLSKFCCIVKACFFYTSRYSEWFVNLDFMFHQDQSSKKNRVSSGSVSHLPWIFRRLLGQQDGRDLAPEISKWQWVTLRQLQWSRCEVRHLWGDSLNSKLRHIWSLELPLSHIRHYCAKLEGNVPIDLRRQGQLFRPNSNTDWPQKMSLEHKIF